MGWQPIPAESIDDLTDVTITTPESGDRLRYDGTEWVNSRRVWMPLTSIDPSTGDVVLVIDDDNSLIPTEVPLS